MRRIEFKEPEIFRVCEPRRWQSGIPRSRDLWIGWSGRLWSCCFGRHELATSLDGCTMGRRVRAPGPLSGRLFLRGLGRQQLRRKLGFVISKEGGRSRRSGPGTWDPPG